MPFAPFVPWLGAMAGCSTPPSKTVMPVGGGKDDPNESQQIHSQIVSGERHVGSVLRSLEVIEIS